MRFSWATNWAWGTASATTALSRCWTPKTATTASAAPWPCRATDLPRPDRPDLTQTLVTYLQEPFYSHNYDRGVIDTFDAPAALVRDLLAWRFCLRTRFHQMVEPRVNVVSMAALDAGGLCCWFSFLVDT